ncbi:uncharacterized protein TRIADDRAFT_58219 [Trichoplax adhaerens]|uniref:Uncharacterized protein n=1 Tax=Trichoplax adhaerens TaxID=10228 RepID=B3S171_TRIAD|nr:predicted protein [Trichoplax adhaerens]EDV23189.1 predicted protein [Trichoplax adhaerens]|eukprot:XP_002114099.1 predicted protein [Trichoplax adhaerens]
MSTNNALNRRQEELIRLDLRRIHVVCWVTVVCNIGSLACCLIYNMNAQYPRNIGIIYVAITCIFLHTAMLIVLCNKDAGPLIISANMRRISGISGISNIMPAVAVVACAINVSGSRGPITTAMSACMMALFVMIFITQNYCVSILKKSIPGFLTLRRLRVHAGERRSRNRATNTNTVPEVPAVLPSYNQATGAQDVTESQDQATDLPCYEDVYNNNDSTNVSQPIPPSYDEVIVNNTPISDGSTNGNNSTARSKVK